MSPKQLSVKEALNMMQSDMSLWDSAYKEGNGDGNVSLTLNLPWGLGITTVLMKGINDAKARRNAVSAYGDHIRGIIKDKIDDEVVTARAKTAAARAELTDSSDSAGVRREVGVRNPTVPPQPNEKAGQAHEENVEDSTDFGAVLIARRTALTRRVAEVEATLIKWKRELRALDAACTALGDEDAPENSRETTTSPEGQDPAPTST